MQDELNKNIARDVEREIIIRLGARLEQCSVEELIKLLILLRS